MNYYKVVTTKWVIILFIFSPLYLKVYMKKFDPLLQILICRQLVIIPDIHDYLVNNKKEGKI